MAEITVTTASTSSAVTSVNLVFRLSCMGLLPRRLVFLQLVVQSFQADSEEFRRPRFILVGGRQSLHDQFALGFVDCGANGEAEARKRAGIRHRRASEIRRKMLASNRPVLACDRGAFQHVAKFPNI